ncbi:diguanylate cyclase [Ectothiorhodospira variabilis]|uniref:diguanylate cyclase n=1 Tax=Ectothiorhodospira variabilis TaxID=505694 RepID=UPI001EFA2BC0|nr:diguanylate cyclase [Ectothiorhodospira variabilis]MCG5494898.1 diguanylate cyclase [Ectothiorhodospira variabilis]MCG5497697.1 diguanylate cyclase [Ectothiorhodospira variabilis]MCG5504411.1 diguanylate cyclase [Ectothiorhodospira variabilis]MCG5507566.1 diguanylate cyclase [Ectothiorhodospira variabilis]
MPQIYRETGHHVLVVEDSRSVAGLLANKIAELPDLQVRVAGSLAQAKAALEEGAEQFFLAVLDLNLPDAPDGEVVPWVLDQGIPVLVLTAGVSDDERDRLIDLGIIDYINKDNLSEIDHVVRSVERIHRNRNIGVLVVDDSTSARAYLMALLHRYGYRLLEAKDGQSALKLLEERGDQIHLMLCDQHMPGMDGITLITRVRQHYCRTRLCIIGMSNHGSGILSARQLKAGANDFITRPFLEEEFFVRVNQNVALIELIQEMENAANHDPLTSLFNRRYLADAGQMLHEAARRGGRGLGVILMDLDFFKHINDRFGHFGGDEVLTQVAKALKARARASDILVRYGGEEFCLVAQDVDHKAAIALAETLRQAVASMEFCLDSECVKLTLSVGVTTRLGSSLEQMLHEADNALYQAKESGRNRVVATPVAESNSGAQERN